MLACFGLAWPLANLRMWRTRRAEGKGLTFTLVILCGYVAGAVSKVLASAQTQALPPLFWFYLLNGSMVAINLSLQWHLQRGPAREAGRRTDARQAGGWMGRND